MPKQHELLAVRDSARGQSEKVRTGLIHTFQNKRHLFEEKVTTFTPNAEGAASRTESQTLIQSTIVKELEWLTPIVAGALNVEVAIELGNTRSVGDIILESGAVVAKGVPATALLIMSKRLSEIKQLVEAIPTLDPAKSFQLDADKGEGVYQAREIVKNRTSKEQTPIVLYPATPEHPAQTQLITKDVVIGTIRELEWSGCSRRRRRLT